MIDAHQHFWSLSRTDYGWLTPDLGVLYRDYTPADLAPHLDQSGIESTILVQAAPSLEESRYLLEIAAGTDRVAAVVGWVDLASSDVEGQLDELSESPAFRGVRPMIQDLPDDDWMLGEALTPGLRAITERGLCFDALIEPRHLPRLLRLMERHPELAVVVDHGAKPDIRGGRFDPWADDIAAIARETAACCKLSGLVTEAGEGWRTDDLRRVSDHLLACFGADRLLWGSDWPVVEAAGGYRRWREATLELLASLEDAERGAVLGGTAARFYRLGGDPLPRRRI